jgi:hypothetical protein
MRQPSHVGLCGGESLCAGLPIELVDGVCELWPAEGVVSPFPQWCQLVQIDAIGVVVGLPDFEQGGGRVARVEQVSGVGKNRLDLVVPRDHRVPVGERVRWSEHAYAIGTVVVPPSGGHVVVDRLVRVNTPSGVWMNVEYTGNAIQKACPQILVGVQVGNGG